MNKKLKSGSSQKKENNRKISSKSSTIRRYNRLIKSNSKDIEKLAKLYEDLADHNLHERGANIVKLLIKLKPNVYLGYFILGGHYLDKARESEQRNKPFIRYFKQAIHLLEKARDINPDEPRIYALLAEAYAGVGDFEKSGYYLDPNRVYKPNQKKKERTSLTVQFSISSQRIMARAARYTGYMLFNKGNYEKAIKEFEKSLKISPFDFRSQYFLGYIYYNKNELEKSINAFTRCIEILPDSPWPYYNIARGYLLLSEFEKSANFFRYFLKAAKPQNISNKSTKFSEAMLYYSLGMLNWQHEILEDAKKYFSKFTCFIRRRKVKVNRSLLLFPKLLSIDTKLKSLYLSNSFEDLDDKLYSITRILNEILSIVGKDKLAKDTPLTKLLRAKYFVVYNLVCILNPSRANTRKKTLYENGALLTKQDQEELEKGILGFSKSKKDLEEMHFNFAIQAIEGVEKFIEKVRIFGTSGLSPLMQKDIISQLRPYMDIWSQATMKASHGQPIQDILRVQMEEMFKKYISPLPEQTANLSIGKLKEEFEIKTKPKAKKIEVGFSRSFGPFIKVSNSRPNKINANIFGVLCLLAVSKMEDGIGIVRIDHKGLNLSEKRDEIYELRDTLLPIIKNNLNIEIKGNEVIINERKKGYRLGIFKKDEIIVDPSIGNFEHPDLSRISVCIEDIMNVKRKNKEKCLEIILTYFPDFDSFHFLARRIIKSTNLVKKAAELRKIEFNNESWEKIAKDCINILVLCGKDRKKLSREFGICLVKNNHLS